MRNPAITLANDSRRDNPVGRLRFEKDYRLVAKVKATKGIAWSQSWIFFRCQRLH
ncbi:MAG: hypothetical protein WC271_14820 [Bacteroidales bacterium]|nr:hypothetical protein [Bacteroidales bacterium]